MGVIGFTQSLAKELGPAGIRVNAILPGIIRGPRMEEVIRDLARPPADGAARPQAQGGRRHRNPRRFFSLKMYMLQYDIYNSQCYDLKNSSISLLSLAWVLRRKMAGNRKVSGHRPKCRARREFCGRGGGGRKALQRADQAVIRLFVFLQKPLIFNYIDGIHTALPKLRNMKRAELPYDTGAVMASALCEIAQPHPSIASIG